MPFAFEGQKHHHTAMKLDDLDSLGSDLEDIDDYLRSIENTQEYEPIFTALQEQTPITIPAIRAILELFRSGLRETHYQEKRRQNETT